MKIILTSRDKNDLKNDIKKYIDYSVGAIIKDGKLYKVTLTKNK